MSFLLYKQAEISRETQHQIGGAIGGGALGYLLTRYGLGLKGAGAGLAGAGLGAAAGAAGGSWLAGQGAGQVAKAKQDEQTLKGLGEKVNESTEQTMRRNVKDPRILGASSLFGVLQAWKSGAAIKEDMKSRAKVVAADLLGVRNTRDARKFGDRYKGKLDSDVFHAINDRITKNAPRIPSKKQSTLMEAALRRAVKTKTDSIGALRPSKVREGIVRAKRGLGWGLGATGALTLLQTLAEKKAYDPLRREALATGGAQ